LKQKILVIATTLFFLFCLVAAAAGQTTPIQPSGPGQPNIPVLPGTPDLTGTGGPIRLPSGQRFEIKPYIFATEQYTSNVYLTKDNQRSDWITTLGPGLRMALNDPSFGVDFTGNFGYNWYANKTKDDYWSVDGTLGLRYNPTPQITFRVREYILRSENSVAPNYAQGGQPAQPGNLAGTNQGNSPYLQNVVEPSVDWQFSRQGSLGMLYRNNILINDNSSLYQNSLGNTVSPYVNYWFDPHNNIALDYSFSAGSYSGGPNGVHSPDFTSQNPHGRYTYRFDAGMAVFADYAYVYQNNNSPGINYNVNSPSLGIVYNFNPTLTATVQAGWFWMDPEQGTGQDGLVSNLSLTQKDRQTTYTLAFVSGYQQNLFSFDTQGFYKYYQGSALISYSVTQRFNVGFVGTAGRNEYAFTDRKDWIYTVDATASYQLLKWLTISGRAGWQEDDSTPNATNSYDEWHVFLTLSASFDNLL
jgi:hypothetical protein